MRRKKYGKKIFKCWTCNEFGHFSSKCPKREKKYKGKFNPKRDRDKNCLYANENDDDLGFVAIKEYDLDREIGEERVIVTQVENKSYWIIDSGCSHHMTSDMNFFVKKS